MTLSFALFATAANALAPARQLQGEQLRSEGDQVIGNHYREPEAPKNDSRQARQFFKGGRAYPEMPTKRQPSPGRFYMQFPWATGTEWYLRGDGPHCKFGARCPQSLPKGSIDFFEHDSKTWGDSVTHKVHAAFGGTVKIEVTCEVVVEHENGYSAVYYHMGKNIDVVDGQKIKTGDVIGKFADNEPDATCEGGAAFNPHVHFQLQFDGVEVSLQDHVFSGYRFKFDDDLEHYGNSSFYLENVKSGRKLYANDAIPNNPPTDKSDYRGFEGDFICDGPTAGCKKETEHFGGRYPGPFKCDAFTPKGQCNRNCCEFECVDWVTECYKNWHRWSTCESNRTHKLTVTEEQCTPQNCCPEWRSTTTVEPTGPSTTRHQGLWVR